MLAMRGVFFSHRTNRLHLDQAACEAGLCRKLFPASLTTYVNIFSEHMFELGGEFAWSERTRSPFAIEEDSRGRIFFLSDTSMLGNGRRVACLVGVVCVWLVACTLW